MEAGTTTTPLTAKLPILNPREYDLWFMRIEQYFLMTDYSLWEVIKNGNKVLKRTVGTVEHIHQPTPADEKLDRKNEMEARGTLLMALPNKDQLKFHSYQDGKLLMEAIEKRIIKYKPKSTNVAFISSNSTNSTSNTNEANNTAYGFSIAHTQGKTVNSTFVDNLSDVVICAFLASQPNSPQLAREDLEQIDHNDLEEMDLHLEMAILTIRAKRFIKKTCMNLNINGQKIGFDRSKVECFNCLKNKHFAREYRAPKNQENRGREYDRKTVPVENSTENALIAQDGIEGYNWSYQAEEEHPENYALMALTSSGSSSSSDSEVDSCSRTCIKAYATLKEQYDSLSSDYKKSQFNLVSYKAGYKAASPPVENFVNSFEMLENQENVKSRSDKGYHAVPPPYTGNNIPSKPDLMFIDEQVKSESVDVVSNVASSDVKTVESKHNNPQQKEYKEKEVINNGCSRHMTGNKCYLTDYEDYDGGFVSFGDGKGRIFGKGKIKTGTLDFDDVYFYKELKYNMFSVSQMCDKKNNVLFTDTECLVLSSYFKLLDESQVLLRVPRNDNIYSVDLKSVVPTGGLTRLFAKAIIDESNLWHMRLGHNYYKTMNKLKGKQHKASYKAKLMNSISKPLHMLHMDLFGLTNVKSLMKKSYCLVVTDDYSRFSWVFFLATKDETSGILKTFITRIENQLDCKVKVIRCDNGTELKFSVMNQFCDIKGIKREFSIARTPQQNGVAERKNRTLIEAARTMALVIKPHNKTHYELIRGRPPLIDFMKSFGYPVTILNTRDHLGKFDGKPDEGFFFRVVCGNRPDWLFDIDSLTISMKYVPVVIGKQNNGIEGSKVTLLQTLVDLPKDKWAICTKWVFRNKNDETGIVVKNKARLVAQEHTQEEGIDYDEVFVPVARIEAIRLFLAYASFKDFVVYQMDLKSDFLYGKIEDEVYVYQPFGFEDPNFLDKVYKVEKALYGLHQAPRVCQDKYVADILKKFDFSTVKTASTPMEPNKALIKDAKAEDVDVHLYRSMIGSLMYLTASRPDITFAVCACLWYLRDSPFDLEAYSDNDYAQASLDRKSTTGGCQFLGKRLISLQCKKKIIVANSTTEAEYVVAAKKPTESDGFEQIVNFLNANLIKYALTVIVNEASIRRDLRLDDAEGTACLSNAVIFEELTRMRESTNPEGNTGRKLRVLSLEQTKTNQASDIEKLKKRVKKLEGKKKKRTHGLKRLYKVELSARVESFEDEEDQGRINDQDLFRVHDLDGDEVFVDVTTGENVEQDAIVAENVEGITAATTLRISKDDTKDKGKGIMVEPEKPLKKKDQITLDKEVARKLEAEMKAEMDKEERIAREKNEANRAYFPAKRAKEIRNKPPTKAQQKSLMCTYMKSMEGFKQKDIKEKSFDEIKKIFDKVYKRVNTFVDMNTKNVEESLKKTQAEVTEGRLKRAREELKQESAKKQKLNEQVQAKVADDDVVELKREDLEVLRSNVKERFKKTKPVDDMDNLLFQTLKTMFEHHVEDIIWKYQQGAIKVYNWKLFDSCGVYCVTTNNMVYYLIVEKMYPFTNNVLHHLWKDVRLQVDNEVEMAYDLLRLIERQINKGCKPE
uniref:Putative ribonuclease H-like domain-containing protein n=1 Tax=Tanacetum cinerariifolium TaxID=118510 RepID=A0A6L2KJI6_TANCI|nr:putative ribonuclease H-like domain-containing protein [Tanacetum cinerariifolium]